MTSKRDLRCFVLVYRGMPLHVHCAIIAKFGCDIIAIFSYVPGFSLPVHGIGHGCQLISTENAKRTVFYCHVSSKMPNF